MEPTKSSRNSVDPNESRFEFNELFFSRTDESGIIKFGNSVFQRVSVYEWDELLNKPHKIIRNPDTPRAVFRLLWDSIKSGSPIGAYVKNRAKDGRYYWVFAIVTPVEGGYGKGKPQRGRCQAQCRGKRRRREGHGCRDERDRGIFPPDLADHRCDR
ncbi:MAG TPA: PAS domain-containing protein [Hyphomonas sp.]|nr:PAS domain-containing protein [Hyphomonas sp.]